jgi:chromosomal replication initiator protein
MLVKEQEIVTESDYNTWIKPLQPQIRDSKLEIVASNRLTHDFVMRKFWNRISNVLTELTGGVKVELIVSAVKPSLNLQQDSLANSTVVDANMQITTTKDEAHKNYPPNTVIIKAKPSNGKVTSNTKPKSDKEVLVQLHQNTKLNRNYTFDSLVCGSANQLAYAIAMHIAQDPGNRDHNPFFIYGGVGLGKTHLMQSIGNELYKKNPNAKIRYLHANDLIQDIVKASLRQGFEELKRYYNSLDLLLLDDIQFIAGDKAKTQEEFFYIFNHLLERSKQIVITCDSIPNQINGLSDRLVSRFVSGLTVEVQPPELDMRVTILKNNALRNKIDLADEIAFFIAQNIKLNVRELEGALNKVIYHAKFLRKSISIAIAKEALMDLITLDEQLIAIDDIQKAVSNYYKIRVSELLSTKRTLKFVRPRQLAMALSKELTEHSLKEIGSAFGGRDHTTVLHAQRMVNKLRCKDEKIERDYNLLIQMLQN